MAEEIKKISQILIKYPDENGSPQEEVAEIAVKLENVNGLQEELAKIKKEIGAKEIGFITITENQFLNDSEISITDEQLVEIKSYDIIEVTVPSLSLREVIYKYVQTDAEAIFCNTTYINVDGEVQLVLYNVNFDTKLINITNRKSTAVIANDISDNTSILKSIRIGDRVYTIAAGEVTKDSVTNALGWITLELTDNGTSGWQLSHVDSNNNLVADSSGLYYADAQLATQQWVESQGYKELPTVSVENKNEVLTVNEAGLWESKALPTYEGDIENGTVENEGLPVVTAADNGKILTVIDGAWAAAKLPSAEDTTF